jgi:hypothetical protein
MLIRLGLIFDIKFIMLQLLYGASQLRRDTSQIRVIFNKGQIDRPISAKQCVVRNFRAAGNIIFNINTYTRLYKSSLLPCYIPK